MNDRNRENGRARRLLRHAGIGALAASMLAAPALLGCDTTRLAARTTAKVFDRGAPAFEEFYDYETAGTAAQATIMQLEALLRADPGNEIMLEQLVRAYISYSYGWVEDEMEEKEVAGDDVGADRARRRARSMYRRAFALAKHWIAKDHDGLDDAIAGGLEQFEPWLRREFDDRDDAGILFWAGYAWGSLVNVSRDDMAAVADLGFAKAMIARSVALDPTYYHSSGVLFLGVATAQELGADLDVANRYFEQALTQTERKNLLVQANMANTYAVMRQDRGLYLRLLAEVLEAQDPLPEARLGNEIARRRAERYIRLVDQRF